MTDLADLIDRLNGINREGGLDQRKHEIIAQAVEAMRTMAAELNEYEWIARAYLQKAISDAMDSLQRDGYLDSAGSTPREKDDWGRNSGMGRGPDSP